MKIRLGKEEKAELLKAVACGILQSDKIPRIFNEFHNYSDSFEFPSLDEDDIIFLFNDSNRKRQEEERPLLRLSINKY